jgi:hypothetical protein
MAKTFMQLFKSARERSVPLVAVKTADPQATIAAVLAQCSKVQDLDVPALSWDCVRGIQALTNSSASQSAGTAYGQNPSSIRNPVQALGEATKLPELTILFVMNAHKFLDAAFIQAAWNLRDVFKSKGCTLVFLCHDIKLPAELKHDFMVLDEPLPTLEELKTIITGVYSEAKQTIKSMPELTDAVISQAIDATCGLAAFPTEQSVAMSISHSGLDVAGLWDRKRTQIEQTPGLSVWRGSETFADIRGCSNAITFMTRVFEGNNPFRCIVLLDEIEKALAGTEGDLSGVSQEMHGTLLSWMQDEQATGMLSIGPPGAGKTAIPKAAAGSFGVPLIQFDLSGMKGSLVGESGANLRHALAIVKAISQGRTLFVGTCNSIDSLKPELRRRFNFGTFFYDLPNQAERTAIWNLYAKKYQITDGDKLPKDAGWTGAEIKQCCDLAYRLRCSLVEASTYVVPVSVSAADTITRLREQAEGKFISASEPGLYKIESETKPNTGRSFQLSEVN